MYKIYADNRLIYDSEIDDYKIGKGSINLEINKSGSFTFSIYPGHFYYDNFVKLKTVIKVYKSDKIVFRGRILNDVSDYWNNKVLTCEGELGFLQDSIIRPFDFADTPEKLFTKFITDHNNQVDEFKRFKIGTITVTDPNDYIARSNSGYESTLNNLTSRLLDSKGGYLFITHGDDGTDEIPTIHYLADFTNVSSQTIEFGSNLKDYTKTSKAEDIATAIIPLGAKLDDGNSETEDKRLTIASVNNGLDYVFDPSAVALRGWIFKPVEWDDVTDARNLKAKGQAYLVDSINQSITVELNAIDLHLLDHSIESFKIGDYIRITSAPHNFDSTLLCKKQTIDLLKPDNDTVTLGYTSSSFTEYTSKLGGYDKAISESEIKTQKQLSSYDLAMQRMSALMAQSLGVFTSIEKANDNSSIYYLHDQPILKNSKNIWKMTASAFAVSTDGGKTWNAGIDASGNALVNVLSAIGIKAEWIDADNLTAISANLGGWQIDDNAITKTVADPSNSDVLYRISLRPPEEIENGNDTVIFCEKSTDRGATFSPTYTLQANGEIRLGDYSSISPNGLIYLRQTEDSRLSISPDGLMFFSMVDTVVPGSLIYDPTTGLFISADKISGNNLTITNKAELPIDISVNGYEAYNGEIPILYNNVYEGYKSAKLTISGGIITKITYDEDEETE